MTGKNYNQLIKHLYFLITHACMCTHTTLGITLVASPQTRCTGKDSSLVQALYIDTHNKMSK